ncbi:MAG: cysteine--tRNA ligase [Rikenellaceae bacterium]|nr:cysteine--tRNA ligase [Rikenellaceae bacterium]
MTSEFTLYNTLTRSKQVFEPLKPPFVGMYVCGPTVYGDPHLGHARSAVTFDLLFRWLKELGYKVRYVRNITDVGHLENDADQGEDKLAKKARLEQLEPMEVAQYYTDRYHRALELLSVLPPSIEPRASGHMMEQIELVEKILGEGYAYQSNGSVYFDVEKYSRSHDYGRLSGRVLEDMIANSRELDGQGDKKGACDFALWKKAPEGHIMRWKAPWSVGFPGWHLECSAMSVKYLGERFDIHGGGMDLMFPHHEAEMAQNRVACGHDAANFWVHNNMITLNGQKMGKSLGNFITLEELFTGNHPLLTEPFAPMTVRFFILQAHYRSTLDFSVEAMTAARKGLDRLMAAVDTIDKIVPAAASDVDVSDLERRCTEAMNDDLNSPVAIAALFDWVCIINQLHDGTASVSAADLERLRTFVHRMVFDILGLRSDDQGGANDLVGPLVEMLIEIRNRAKAEKDWATSDSIRDELAKIGITLKDRKDGTDWSVKG